MFSQQSFSLLLLSALLVLVVLIFALGWEWWMHQNCHCRNDNAAGVPISNPHIQTTAISTRTMIRRRRYCNLILLFTFEASIISLTLAAAKYPEPLLGLIGMMMATILLWFPLVILTEFIGRTKCWTAGLVFSVMIFAILPGFTLLISHYYKQADTIDSYTYFGPMVITNVSTETTKPHTTGLGLRGGQDKVQILAAVQLTWYDVQCPLRSPGNMLCETTIYDSDCILQCINGVDTASCNMDDVALCLQTKYSNEKLLDIAAIYGNMDDDNNRAWSELPQATKSLLSLGDDDEYHSNPVFFGNCHTCQAMDLEYMEGLQKHTQSLQFIGTILVLSGLCILVMVLIGIGASKTLMKLQGDNDDNRNSSNEETDPADNPITTADPDSQQSSGNTTTLRSVMVESP